MVLLEVGSCEQLTALGETTINYNAQKLSDHFVQESSSIFKRPEFRIMSETDSQNILNTYKAMTSECQTIANKISELTSEKDEHKLVVDTLTKLESGRKAFRLVGGVLVERTVEEVLPAVSQNFEGVSYDSFLPWTALCSPI